MKTGYPRPRGLSVTRLKTANVKEAVDPRYLRNNTEIRLKLIVEFLIRINLK